MKNTWFDAENDGFNAKIMDLMPKMLGCWLDPALIRPVSFVHKNEDSSIENEDSSIENDDFYTGARGIQF